MQNLSPILNSLKVLIQLKNQQCKPQLFLQLVSTSKNGIFNSHCNLYANNKFQTLKMKHFYKIENTR